MRARSWWLLAAMPVVAACVVFSAMALGAGDKPAPDKSPEAHRRSAEGAWFKNDVRGEDISDRDLSKSEDPLDTFMFDQDTVWPPASKMPAGFDPKSVLENAKNPGLGVRELHKEGITGKGVNVAIIDHPLYRDHPEYADKIAGYFDTGSETAEASMHSPSVTSILVGTTCGTAPDARVYFAGAPSWKADAAYYARALDWIIKENEALPEGRKIRAVSVSAAPSGPVSPFTKNNSMWDEACERAEKAGILIVDCEMTRGFIGACYYDARDPENPAKCTPGFPGFPPVVSPGEVLVPASVRTTAGEPREGHFTYAYWGKGGLSWGIPYATGVLAMGWQVRPDLSGAWMRYLLYDSAYVQKGGARIINPREFIRRVRAAKVAPGEEPPAMPKRELRGGPGMTVTAVKSVEAGADMRWKDMSKLDLSADAGLLATVSFNEKTVWPDGSKLPAGWDPKAVMTADMNPGLGVRELHREGLTGKGVSVAILDQPVLEDHPEFRGKFADYYDTGCGSDKSMKGPIAASVFVGAKCGVAPDARLYYVAVPEWLKDAGYYARGLDWIIKRNESLAPADRIRIVAVESSLANPWFEKNREAWPEAFERARKAGVLVVELGDEKGRCFAAGCSYGADREDVTKCVGAFLRGDTAGFIFVPAAPRTAAEELTRGECGYVHFGTRWGIGVTAYCAGVFALGWQARPDLSADEMKELLFKSAYARPDGAKIVNPREFIKLVKAAKRDEGAGAARGGPGK